MTGTAEAGPATPDGAGRTVSLRAVEDIVEVDPGASCLQRDRLAHRVARWLNRATIDIPLSVHVRGDPRVATRVFFSVLTVPGSPAERRLDNVPSDCDQQHSAVALSIALAIEATLQQELAAATGAVTAKPPRARTPAPEPMHLELALLAGANIGVLTDTALTGSPRLTFTPLPWLQFAIATLGTHLTGQRVETLSGRFEATVLAIGLDGCVGGEATQALGFYMCIGGRGGQFRSSGRGFGTAGVRFSSAWWALAGSAQATFWLSPAVALGTSVESLYAPIPRSITVDGAGDLPTRRRTVPSVALSVTVGPVFRLF